VAVHINAFNFPGWGMGEKMACAILAGVPVIEKPGTASALLAWRMAKIIVDSGILPEGAFQFIAGSTGDLLDHLGPQDCLSFTGSSVTGRLLKSNENLLKNNVRINIEADSVNSTILAPDADNEAEAYNLFLQNTVLEMTQKAGQKCTAVRRILVPEDRIDEVVADLKDRLADIKVGDPTNADHRMGPLASKEQFDDVRAGIHKLTAVAEIVCGGPDPIADKGFFVAPTLLVAKDPRAAIIHGDEVFGPVATVIPYSGDAAAAIELANLAGGCLVASVYGNDRRWLEKVVLGISPWHGRVWIGSDKVAGHAMSPGAVMPQSVHGGPGRAGGGEELGGLRGLSFYLQRTAVQGYQGLVAQAFGPTNE
jgi:oxepin-CoA hydrolase/3-oxo-5,6-dehydrosuberyl-CoA semialdehyde dehydrogenase